MTLHDVDPSLPDLFFDAQYIKTEYCLQVPTTTLENPGWIILDIRQITAKTHFVLELLICSYARIPPPRSDRLPSG